MNHGMKSTPFADKAEQASLRRDLMKAVGDLLETAADKHQTQDLVTAVYAVQKTNMELNHRPEIVGLPGLSGMDPEEL